jgi:hypothetical protein
LAILPVILIWAHFRSAGERRRYVLLSAASIFTLLAVCTPWTIRNYIVFKEVVPIRSNLWIEMRVGNTGDTSDIVPDWAHPANGHAEMLEYKAVGEIAYAKHKRQQTLAFIGDHPALYAWLTVRRITYFWTGIWSVDPDFRRREPLQFANAFRTEANVVHNAKPCWIFAGYPGYLPHRVLPQSPAHRLPTPDRWAAGSAIGCSLRKYLSPARTSSHYAPTPA